MGCDRLGGLDQLAYATMLVQDAIRLADFLVDTTKGFVSLLMVDKITTVPMSKIGMRVGRLDDQDRQHQCRRRLLRSAWEDHPAKVTGDET